MMRTRTYLIAGIIAATAAYKTQALARERAREPLRKAAKKGIAAGMTAREKAETAARAGALGKAVAAGFVAEKTEGLRTRAKAVKKEWDTLVAEVEAERVAKAEAAVEELVEQEPAAAVTGEPADPATKKEESFGQIVGEAVSKVKETVSAQVPEIEAYAVPAARAAAKKVIKGGLAVQEAAGPTAHTLKERAAAVGEQIAERAEPARERAAQAVAEVRHEWDALVAEAKAERRASSHTEGAGTDTLKED
jgi:hypothetical protein